MEHSIFQIIVNFLIIASILCTKHVAFLNPAITITINRLDFINPITTLVLQTLPEICIGQWSTKLKERKLRATESIK